VTEAEWNELAELAAKIIQEAVHEAIRETVHPSVLRDRPGDSEPDQGEDGPGDEEAAEEGS
jgi:hypothetical protein